MHPGSTESTRNLLGGLLLGAALGGCAPPAPPQAPAMYEYQVSHLSNGKPLRFEAKDSVRTVDKKVRVGERQVYSASGRYVGKEVVYTTEPTEVPFHEWHVYQGDTEIDALSALRIARDAAFETAYDQERERVRQSHARALELYETDVLRAQSKKNLGLGLGIVGIVGMLGAGVLFAATKNDPSPPVPSAAAGAISLGFMAVGIGGFYVRGQGSREQDAAMRQAESLAGVRMENKFQRFATEEHVRNVVEGQRPRASAPAETTAVPEIRMAKTLDPALTTGIPNNEKLGPALIAIWTPEAYGIDHAKAHEVFERELLRSVLYYNNAGGKMPRHEGNLAVYTDEASLRAAEGDTSKPEGMPAVKLLALAVAMQTGIYVHHEGQSSVFTVLDGDTIQKLLLRATEPK
ncbi:hypothetical protein [Polyangium fumosum]|uniref:Uncharacterized protein n=1 Tax=Polyangium fumosum TaxID=889272 RepID=A0A4U1IQL9_9BACT|nr:hypothetical protein [Polyangium fumosum]TKC96524.1 hypothetical protein E8A74_45140 [Polyangium fumosum]